MTDLSEPWQRLREARRSAGFETATAAADALNMKHSTYLGHENGGRGITAASAKRYARLFRVEPNWILFGGGTSSSTPAATGLSEPAAVPFEPPPPAARDNANIFWFRLNAHFPFAALRADDVILVERTADPAPGDTVVVNSVSQGTMVRLWFPPWLAPAAQGDTPLTLSDDPDLAVYGRVVGVLRGIAIETLNRR